MRAYILYAQVYSNIDQTAESYKEKAALLEKARKELPQEQTALVLKELAQAYIDLYAIDNDISEIKNAINVLKEVVSRGWGNLTTLSNLAILYQESGDLPAAEQVAKEMAEKYANRYEPFKRLCFIEAAKQQNKEIESRDYHMFETYYKKTIDMYGKRSPNQAEDTEVRILEEAYRDLKEEGWL